MIILKKSIWALCAQTNFLTIIIIKIGFLKARQRRVFKKPILAFPAPKALEMPKSVSY
jgi:hypothetical protein